MLVTRHTRGTQWWVQRCLLMRKRDRDWDVPPQWLRPPHPPPRWACQGMRPTCSCRNPGTLQLVKSGGRASEPCVSLLVNNGGADTSPQCGAQCLHSCGCGSLRRWTEKWTQRPGPPGQGPLCGPHPLTESTRGNHGGKPRDSRAARAALGPSAPQILLKCKLTLNN